jgi:hypothetical protein
MRNFFINDAQWVTASGTDWHDCRGMPYEKPHHHPCNAGVESALDPVLHLLQRLGARPASLPITDRATPAKD